MEVQKSKQIDIEDVSDYYITRRTIDTTEPQYIKIDSVGLTDNNEVAIKSKLGGEDILIVLGEHTGDNINLETQMDINYFFNDIISPDCIYDENDIEGSEFKAFISDDLQKLGIKNNELRYDIRLENDIELQEIPSNVFRNVSLWNAYTKAKINKSPWVHNIEKIIPGNKRGQFELVVQIFEDYKVTWELEVPFQTDIKKDPLAKLIENEGYGDLENLDEEGEVVIMHKSDLDEEIEIIGFDTTGEWALITKKEFEYTSYDSIPTLMETLDYFGNSILMGLLTFVMGSHLIGIIQMAGFQHLYLPTAIIFAISAIMTFFLLDMSSKLPREKFKTYLNIN